MGYTIPPIDIETVDRRRLLRALGRAVDEEAAECLSGDRFRMHEGERERHAYLRALMAEIQAHNSILPNGPAPLPTGPGPTPRWPDGSGGAKETSTTSGTPSSLNP
jgi:hypothetical protein